MHYSNLIEALKPVMREAGAAIMEIYDRGPTAIQKGDGSPVSDADQAADAIILAALAKIAPDIAVVSEENSKSHAIDAPKRFFLVDPLDGTKEFLKHDGKGSFTVNIALIEDGAPTLGLVYAPALDRMFSGYVGGPVEETKTGFTGPIRAAKVPQQGKIAVASASHRDAQTDQWLSENAVETTVSIGSSLKFCLVATGEAHVYPRFGTTMEWDTAAGDAVLRAAGGGVKNPDGSVFAYGKPEFRNGPFIAWGLEG